MKTYIYKITPRKNDVNGNPRSLVTVYRIKKNEPLLLGENVNIGFRGDCQAVCDIIHVAENRPKNYLFILGSLNKNPVWKAHIETTWKKPKIRLIKV